ncbi:MAG: threonine--tRNA ligase [Planctomycetota bacterium]|jgi:threonyl-tRNA synthetase
MRTTLRLPDSTEKAYEVPVTPACVAEDIGPCLASAAVAAELDGKLCDLKAQIEPGCHELRIITNQDGEALEVLRHTASHVLAQAVVRLYGPSAQYTIGPPLTDDFQYGFYYDFELPKPISAEDLQEIEARMRQIVAEKVLLERVEVPADEAKRKFQELGQAYKVEMIDELVQAEGVKTVSLYRQGDFLDMCRGPHLPDTGKLGQAFKLLATAGAYWRGDEAKKMLTRIYGTAFFDEKQLDEHLRRIEEARKRDHRIIGRQLGLFIFTDAVGPGLPLWLPKGTIIRMELEGWLQSELLKRGYQPVVTPHIGKIDMYRTSGHYPHYEHGLFPTMRTDQDEGYLLKPMNCPHHIQIYEATQRSYRELPIRLSEFGTVYRFEQSGELSGLTRVRGFTQDDAHIFCTPEQLESEIESCAELTKLALDTLGLNEYRVRIGLRDPDSSKYIGDAGNWDLAEANIRNVVMKLGLDYTEEPGEAAFYGPKIDYVAKDCLGREWQLGTIQVDYNLPERFGLEYVGADNQTHRPVMIHRAPLGSPERFIGILIEHFAGAFPLWLSPVQVSVLPVSQKFNDYAVGVAGQLRTGELRVEVDDSDDKVGAKIRRATLGKVPYMAVVGRREAEAKTVAVRHRTEGDRGAMSVDAFLRGLREEIESKGKSRALVDEREK